MSFMRVLIPAYDCKSRWMIKIASIIEGVISKIKKKTGSYV